MIFKRQIDMDEWHKIGDKLTESLEICDCQRKIKSIIDALYNIHEKCNNNDYDFNGAEWLLIALLDRDGKKITHGINCEYPIINKEDEFWEWITKVKDNPNLEDN